MSTAEQARQERRDEKIMDFVLGCLVTAVGGSMGRTLPDEANARDLVRLARAAYEELDNPSEPESDEKASPEPTEAPGPTDLVEELFG